MKYIITILVILYIINSLQIRSLAKHIVLYQNQVSINQLNGNVIPLVYNKAAAISPIFLYSLGKNYWDTNMDVKTIFTKNFSDRGNDKLLYMNAITTDKYKYYAKWTNNLTDSIETSIDRGEYIIGSIKRAIIHFFIQIHYSIDSDNSQYSLLYVFFEKMIDFTSTDESMTNIIKILNGSQQLRDMSRSVYRFTEQNVYRILNNKLADNFPYYWHNNGNGFSITQIINACLHNVVAFSQFIIISNSIIGDKFNLYKELYRSDPYSAIREIYRLNPPSGKIFSQSDGKQVCHHLQNIMRNSDNSYDKINSISYDKYTTKSSSKLIVSNIDNETVIESENSGNIPIYTKPKYCPFGLGYRRCAGENFSYFVTKHLCDVFFKYKYKEKGKLGREKTKRKIEAKTKIGLFNMVTNNKLLV